MAGASASSNNYRVVPRPRSADYGKNNHYTNSPPTVNVALVGWINKSLVWVPPSEGLPGGFQFEVDFKSRSKTHGSGRHRRDVSASHALFERENTLPVILHANDGPAHTLRLVVQRLREGADLGVR